MLAKCSYILHYARNGFLTKFYIRNDYGTSYGKTSIFTQFGHETCFAANDRKVWIFFFYFSIWFFFFHNYSQITGLQGKREGISLTPHYHFHPLHRHLDISWAITAESSLLHIGSSQTQTRNLWFPSASC